jgi:tRNA nucleotidyltransferase/poly(A) polymerase
MSKLVPDWLPPRSGAYLVGGCVRDLLLGREPTDYDVALLGAPAAYAMEIASATGGRVVEIGKPAFRIWRVAARGRLVDVAAAAGQSIADDLRQRDFSINALAVDVATGSLIDVTDGRGDLDRGTIRMVSPEAFEKDPLRLLRAFRLAAHLGFAIGPETSAAIRSKAVLIRRSAGERVRVELFKLLSAPRSHAWVCTMAKTALLAGILPELEHLDARALERRLGAYRNLETILADPAAYFPLSADAIGGCLSTRRRILLKIAALVLPAAAPPSTPQRLRFSRRDEAHFQSLVHYHAQTLAFLTAGKDSPRDRVRFFRAVADALPDLLLLAAADGALPSAAGQALRTMTDGHLSAFFSEYRPAAGSVAPITGDDLIQALGLSPSRLFRDILEFVEEERLLCPNMSRSEALEVARQCLKRLEDSRGR